MLGSSPSISRRSASVARALEGSLAWPLAQIRLLSPTTLSLNFNGAFWPSPQQVGFGKGLQMSSRCIRAI